MKNFKKRENLQIQAVQYGTPEAQDYVARCKTDYKGIIQKLPEDLLGTPAGSFFAVKTPVGFVKVESGDWIVQKNNEIFVVPDGVFKCMFEEI